MSFKNSNQGSSATGHDRNPNYWFPKLNLRPNNYEEWIAEVLRYVRGQQGLPQSVARSLETGNTPIYVKRPYIYGVFPDKYVANYDSTTGDEIEVDIVFLPGEPPENIADYIAEIREQIPYPNKIDSPDAYREAEESSKVWAEKSKAFRDAMPIVCGQLEMCLSEDSRKQINAHYPEEWKTYSREADGYNMLRIIRLAHTISAGARPTPIETTTALAELQSMRQHDLPLRDYYDLFVKQLERCRSLNVTVEKLSQSEAIYHFINGVTDRRSAIVRDVMIADFDKPSFPATLHEAFTRIFAAIQAR